MRRAPVFWTIVVLCAAFAFAHAWALRWTCDDAFISFRYAGNLVAGHGLVFNLDPQEMPVEGYTNFAWTLWLALGLVLGWTGDALETWAACWGALLHAGTVLVLGYAAWRSSRGRAIVPIAAPAWAVHYYGASLAPAGLETALFVFLATTLAVLAIDRSSRRRLWLLGGLGVLAATTRPDGALLVMAAGVVVLADAIRARAPRDVVAYAAPLVLGMVPYLLWRHAYYGYWVPNTFYAKSGADPYASQGLHYVLDYVACHAVALVPALLALLLLPLRRGDPAAAEPWSCRRAGLALLLFVVPYVAFVVWVGGDFMFGRFLLPVTPLLMLALDVLFARRPWLAPCAALVAVAGTWWRHDPPGMDDFGNPAGYSDNRAISMLPADASGITRADYARGAGHAVGDLFAGLGVRIGIAGGHANFAWRWPVPVAIECAAGLTDAYIAHLPIPARSRPGHERNWHLYPGYLEQRGVHFMLEESYGNGTVVDHARAITFPGRFKVGARIVTWDRALMRELRRRAPDLVCVDFEQELDKYIAALPTKPKDQVRADYAALREFYFDRNDDPARRSAIERFLEAN